MRHQGRLNDRDVGSDAFAVELSAHPPGPERLVLNARHQEPPGGGRWVIERATRTVLIPLPSSTMRRRSFKAMSLQTVRSPSGRFVPEPRGKYGPESEASACMAAASEKRRPVGVEELVAATD